jgi:hypothetical protein
MTILKYTLRSTFWALSLTPYLFIAGVIFFAVRAYFYLGHWPRPSFPDPQFIPFEMHQLFLWDIFSIFGYSLVLVPLLYFLFLKIYKDERSDKLALKYYVSGVLLNLILVLVPTINVVAWFID